MGDGAARHRSALLGKQSRVIIKKEKTEKNLLWILQELFALGNEVPDNASFGLQLTEGLFLSLNQLFDVFNAAGCDVTGRAEHNAVQELNVRLQFVSIGVTLPVQIHLDLSLQDGGDQLFMLEDDGVKFLHLFRPLLFSTLSHQDFQDVLEPFFDLSTL